MPTRQMQQTRPAPPITKTRITQKQSQEIVQTLLLGGLSTLTWTREFFAEKTFTEQFYENCDRIPSYNDVSSCRLPRKKATLPGTSMQILQRHRSKRADLFLDWLEKGAFPKLKQGILHAVQICVHLNSDDREQVVETYTFTIKYHTDHSTGEKLAGLEVNNHAGEPVTLEATSEAMQKMIRGIQKLTSRLPSLPSERYVSMSLFYTQDDDKQYQPTGFEPSATNELRFATARGWSKNTKGLGNELHSAFHSTTLKVSYLGDTDISEKGPGTYPPELAYGNPVSAQADIDIPPPQEADAETVVSQTPMQRQESLPSTIGSNRGVDSLITQMETPVPTAATAATRRKTEHSAADGDLNTQSSVVPRMKSALSSMMLPEHLSQGDTQTQMPMRRPSAPARTISRVPDSPIQDQNSTTPGDSYKDRPPATTNMMLLPELADVLAAKRSQLRETALSLSQTPDPDPDVKQEITLCQCGYGQEAEEMVECVHCNTWQHMHCYGFSGSADPRLPEDHICYQCLFGGIDEDTLAKLKALAVKRRGMSFVLQDGLRRKTDLAKLMGISADTAQTLHAHLRSYVVNARGSHKPGFAAKNKAPWVPADPGHPNNDKMLRELFDPLLHIEHCYATQPTVTKSVAEQLQALRSETMPAPSTPVGLLHTKRASSTPGDDLDLHPSTSPFKTPMRRPTVVKRGRDEDEEFFDTPAKRQASATPLYLRLKSVQSRFILNADGKSSPATRT